MNDVCPATINPCLTTKAIYISVVPPVFPEGSVPTAPTPYSHDSRTLWDSALTFVLSHTHTQPSRGSIF